MWQRSVFTERRTWIAVAIALACALPYLGWQIATDYPFVDFIGAYNSTPPKAMVLQNPVLGMLLTMNPGYALFWAIGSVFCLISESRALRVLGTAAWICLALFVLAGVKFYFAVPVFGFFSIAGALFWEQWTAVRLTRPLRAMLIALALSGVLSVPAAAPVLPPERLQQLANFMRDGEQGFVDETPAELERYFPHFAEMHGWPELVAATANAWASLSPDQRDGAFLLGSYYGHSAALNLLDHDEQLPPAFGRHMNYHLWNVGLDFRRGLFVGFERAELEALFATVEERGRFTCERCMSRDNAWAFFTWTSRAFHRTRFAPRCAAIISSNRLWPISDGQLPKIRRPV